MSLLLPRTTLHCKVRLWFGCGWFGCVSVVQKKIGFFFCVALALHYFCSAINGSWFFQVKEPAAMKARTLTLL